LVVKRRISVAIGICAEGNYSKEEMPKIQKETVVELCEYLMVSDGTNPGMQDNRPFDIL
jgi:hypothetical protein